MRKSQKEKILRHEHSWVPIDVWGHQGTNEYSMQQGCVCGAFRIIDAMQVVVGQKP